MRWIHSEKKLIFKTNHIMMRLSLSNIGDNNSMKDKKIQLHNNTGDSKNFKWKIIFSKDKIQSVYSLDSLSLMLLLSISQNLKLAYGMSISLILQPWLLLLLLLLLLHSYWQASLCCIVANQFNQFNHWLMLSWRHLQGLILYNLIPHLFLLLILALPVLV